MKHVSQILPQLGVLDFALPELSLNYAVLVLSVVKEPLELDREILKSRSRASLRLTETVFISCLQRKESNVHQLRLARGSKDAHQRSLWAGLFRENMSTP